MSEGDVPSVPDHRIQVLVEVFGELSPGDQDQVMTLITRLREGDVPEEYARDVPFMDFDE